MKYLIILLLLTSCGKKESNTVYINSKTDCIEYDHYVYICKTTIGSKEFCRYNSGHQSSMVDCSVYDEIIRYQGR